MGRFGDSQGEDGLSIRNRARLPAGRSLTISVTWLRMPGVMMLALALAALSFFAGVTAGSGGWYREMVTSMLNDSAVRRLLLTPNQTNSDTPTPTMRDRLEIIEARLGTLEVGQENMRKEYVAIGSAFASYVEFFDGIDLELRQLVTRTTAAGEASQAARDQIDVLVSAVIEAQRARAAAQRTPRAQWSTTQESADETE